MRHLIFCALLCGIATALSTGSQRNAQSLKHERNAQSLKHEHQQGIADERIRTTPPLLKLKLHSPNGMQFIGEITIGGQTLSALYDTGSFDIIAVSQLCDVCRVPPNLPLYSNKSSGTFQQGNRPVKGHMFPGGVVWAKEDYETVHIGSADSPLSVEKAPFWQVVHTDMRLWTGNKSKFSTYVGLGHTSVVPGMPKSEEQMKSLLELSGTKRFGICLDANSGYLVFNPTYALTAPASSFRSVPVIGKNHWAVDLKSVSYDNLDSLYGQQVAIIDSGTALIGAPPKYFDFIEKISKRIKGDCSNIDELPDVVFELGDKKFALPASAYVIRAAWDDSYCYAAFMDIGFTSDKGEVWILGVPFLRHFYTVFDRDGPSIHMAERDDDCEPVSSPPAGSGSFLHPAGLAKRRRVQPVIADITQASGPLWAQGKKHVIL